MNKTASRRLFAPGFAALLSVITASTGHAQMPMSGGSPMAANPATRHGSGATGPDKPVVAEPDSIPGAKARAPAAPATRAAGDLQPTDALFDAINRGDIASARDALNRGADLNGVNVLGMTPMELSVDLGRNDISFLLLSMRGEDSGRGSRAVARGTQAEAPPAAAKVAQAKKSAAAPAKPVAEAVKPVAAPKLFANDGGTPLPSAGFLGFGSRSASN